MAVATTEKEPDAHALPGHLEFLASEVSDEALLACAPEDWTPTPEMMRYATVYVSAPPRATLSEMARQANVSRGSVMRWRKGAYWRGWMAQVLLMGAGLTVGKVWKAVAEKASKGDIRASGMMLRRFDPSYRTAMQESEAKRDTLGPDSSAVVAARANLTAQHADRHDGQAPEEKPEPEGVGGGGEGPIHSNMSPISAGEKKPPDTKTACPVDCQHYTVEISEPPCSECNAEDHPKYQRIPDEHD